MRQASAGKDDSAAETRSQIEALEAEMRMLEAGLQDGTMAEATL
jgi:BMFP domain-containing protein YqiC